MVGALLEQYDEYISIKMIALEKVYTNLASVILLGVIPRLVLKCPNWPKSLGKMLRMQDQVQYQYILI